MTINYEYFANGWLKAVKKGANLVASYTYDTSGNRTRVDFGNGTYQVFDYDSDPRYRLASIDYAYGCDDDEDIEVRGTLDVTRDKTGNPLTWGNDDYKKQYAYDDNNRLKSADYPGKSTVNWGYDWVGNRLDTGFTYNAADQLTASPGKSYTYDGNGNMLTGTMSFSYTYTNLVATAGNTSMGWDSMGNRVSFTTSGSATYQFVYDPTAGIPAALEEVVSGTSTYYVRDPSGALIARLTGENQTPAYYHFDELGSTLFLTDPDGILTDKYTYETWGNVTSHTGSTSQPYQYVGQLGYYTHYQEAGFKLMQLGVRLYDPETGRFMQRDRSHNAPASSYAYVGGNPLSWVDPYGNVRRKPTFPDIPNDWKKAIASAWGKYCNKNTVSKKMLRCLIFAESNDGKDPLNPDKDAAGLMQIRHEWYKPRAGEDYKWERDSYCIHQRAGATCQQIVGADFNIWDPLDSITCGIYLLCKVHGGKLKGEGGYGTGNSGRYNDCMKRYTWSDPEP